MPDRFDTAKASRSSRPSHRTIAMPTLGSPPPPATGWRYQAYPPLENGAEKRSGGRSNTATPRGPEPLIGSSGQVKEQVDTDAGAGSTVLQTSRALPGPPSLVQVTPAMMLRMSSLR